MSDSEKRQRTMTEKAEEHYDSTVAHMSARIEKRRAQLNEIASYVRGISAVDKLKDIHKQGLLVFGEYRLLIEDFIGYLEKQRTEKSDNKLKEVESLHTTFETVVNSVFIQIELKIDNIEATHEHEHTSSLEEDNVAIQLSKFLVRKDLMLSRLMKFDDKPENYQTWKTSFKSVVEEVGVDSREELDLLVKWLGKDSVRHAINIRASSSPDPKASLSRLWERLDERYGSVEMLDAALRKKLERFPKLSPKDTYQLYELADLVEEIASHMENPKYKDSMTYYNTSIGIIPVVNKLPVYLQERWTVKVFEYKKKEKVLYPPFKYLSQFIREMSLMKNDPGFVYTDKVNRPAVSTSAQSLKLVSTMKTNIDNSTDRTCFYHNTTGHTLNECRTFKSKPITVRKKLLRDKGVCYKCCEQSNHRAADCKSEISCDICKKAHATALHVSDFNQSQSNSSSHGGENNGGECDKRSDVNTACVQVCGNKNSKGKSCAKVVSVVIYPKSDPINRVRAYALLDDQSNKTLVSPKFFDIFPGQFNEISYSLSSCAGKIDTTGRRAAGFIVENLQGTRSHELPDVTECREIPDVRDEIPSPQVAKAYTHLRDLAHSIPELDPQAPILLLIGRDLMEAHHVLKQRIGPRGQPFAQEYSLGWVVIGETCLGGVHVPDSVRTYKTYIHHDNRASIFPPCELKISVKDRGNIEDSHFKDIFVRTPDDEKRAMSIEDREFIDIMQSQFQKSPDGRWIAPLPFKASRVRLPNNREQAKKRAYSLQHSLHKNPEKEKHFVEFMKGIFDKGYAEIAPPLKEYEECWYLPIFGVYHAKKGQIRVVFDSSAQYQGVSLNSVLLQGPDLMNSLLGVLMRFRREEVAVMADIQQMFFQFQVKEEHRNFLRFLWYRDNDPSQDIIEYRMCSHVFGNSPSPAIASYGLLKTAVETEHMYGHDVRDLIHKDFYVDDGLSSFKSSAEAIDTISRTHSDWERPAPWAIVTLKFQMSHCFSK